MTLLFVALSIASAIVLAVIILRFFVDYVRRPADDRHPVSLAIVSTLLLFVFYSLSTFVVKDAGGKTIRLTMLVGELVVAAHYGIAFWVGRRRDGDGRPRGRNGNENEAGPAGPPNGAAD